MKDHYKWLGINYDASPDEIKSAYRRLALKFHPDKNNGNTQYEAIFRDINESYEVLSNPESKKEYDALFFKKEEPQYAQSQKYYKSPPQQPQREYINVNPSFKQVFITFCICMFVVSILAYLTADKNPILTPQPKTGELSVLPPALDTTRTAPYVANATPAIPSQPSVLNNYEGWEATNYFTGDKPTCYNFHAKYDYSIGNSLDVTVSNTDDVALKLVNYYTNKCIRYVYIKAGDFYSIKNIPLGKYYLKIAYGLNWRQKIINGKCVGKFMDGALYKRGQNILIFDKQYTGQEEKDGEIYNTYNYSYYKLSLQVTDVNPDEKYSTNEINENDFND